MQSGRTLAHVHSVAGVLNYPHVVELHMRIEKCIKVKRVGSPHPVNTRAVKICE